LYRFSAYPPIPFSVNYCYTNSMNPLALTYGQFAEAFRKRFDRGHFHAAAVYRAFYAMSAPDICRLPAFHASPELGRRVQQELAPVQLPRIVERIAEDGAEKVILELVDRLRIESVVIPMPGYTTLCISSQVGCRMGCRFCRTGSMGLQRQLDTDEIVAQVYCARIILGYPIRNVVFMGMGEPLDNFAAVTQAIRVLNDQRGLNIALRHITVSTAGLVEGIRHLAEQFGPSVNLALSLNAAVDDLRGRLMPINRRYPLAVLKTALQDHPLGRGRVLFIEYVLIRDLNDSPAHALDLAMFLRDLPVKVNLIAYNPDEHSPWQAPEEATVRQFQALLAGHRIFVRRRTSRGAHILAACGQLGGSAGFPRTTPKLPTN
jgi:23S rRNA (adenine2503-C2)-methyltransferase